MSIQASCEACGREFKAKDSLAGKRVKCPGCGEPVHVPAAADETSGDTFDFPDEFSQPMTAPSRRRSQSSAYDLPSRSRDEEDDGDRISCPMCGEKIMRQATKCRFCGEVLRPGFGQVDRLSRRSSSSAGDDIGAVELIMIFCCPGIACIVGIVRMLSGNESGGKLVLYALLSAGFWFVVQLIASMVAHVAQ